MNYFTIEKHYNTLNNYYRAIYHQKVFKIALNAGFSCPNKKTGGCTFCLDGSGEYGGDINESLQDQFVHVKTMMERKWPDSKYVIYFQSNTNTYAPLDVLKKTYEETLTFDENIVGINISTRPDCLDKDIVNYLKELNKRTDVVVELGLQTINDKTLLSINRGHTYQDFLDGYKLLKDNGINCIVHIINGLQGETEEDMLATVKALAKLDIYGIKIHMLDIMENTTMGKAYKENPWKMLTLEEYVNIVIKQLEYLPDTVIINRITGDAPKEYLIAPLWTLKKFVVFNEIDKIMRRDNIYQGDLYKSTIN